MIDYSQADIYTCVGDNHCSEFIMPSLGSQQNLHVATGFGYRKFFIEIPVDMQLAVKRFIDGGISKQVFLENYLQRIANNREPRQHERQYAVRLANMIESVGRFNSGSGHNSLEVICADTDNTDYQKAKIPLLNKIGTQAIELMRRKFDKQTAQFIHHTAEGKKSIVLFGLAHFTYARGIHRHLGDLSGTKTFVVAYNFPSDIIPVRLKYINQFTETNVERDEAKPKRSDPNSNNEKIGALLTFKHS